MTKYCISCGKEVNAGAKFCQNCGHQLSGKIVKAKKSTVKKKDTGEESWSKNTRTVCGIVLVLAVVLAVALVWMGMNSMGVLMQDSDFSVLMQGSALGEMYNTTGTPLDQECITAEDCVCENEKSMFCQPTLLEWECVEGMCEPVEVV